MGMNRSRGRMEADRPETDRVPFTGSRHITSSNRRKILMGRTLTDKMAMDRTLMGRIPMDRTVMGRMAMDRMAMDRMAMGSRLMRMGKTAMGSRRNR